MFPAVPAQFGTGVKTIRVCPGSITDTLTLLEEIWWNQLPEWAFENSFLDQEFNRLYHSEDLLGQIAGYFTMLALFIACLGLFGNDFMY